MSTAFAIANIQHSLQALKEKIAPEKWGDTPLPIIVAPGWWLEDVRKELGIEPGYEPESIHGCTVLRKEELTEPMLVDYDGSMYPLLPAWMRAKKVAAEGGEA